MIEFIQKFWLETILSTIAFLIGAFLKISINRVKKEVAEQQLLKAGQLAILHDRLYQACSHFIKIGYITVGELDNLEHLYNAYHALGGNGTGTELFKRCSALEIKADVQTKSDPNAF